MKNIILFVSAWIIFIGCKNSDKPHDDSEITNKTKFTWVAAFNDSTGKFEVIKKDNTGPDSVNVNSLIAYLNETNTNVLLNLIKLSGDTIYLSIPDAEYLTQQMGSSGPINYFATVVYNLTEISGIKFVNFDFDLGDHASPGVYSRESFKNEF